MKDIQSISVELSSRYADLYFHATQFDTARQFLLVITKNGQPCDLSKSEVFFNVRYDGGEIFSCDCEVLDSAILVKNPTEILKQKGKIEYTLGIVSDVSYDDSDFLENIDDISVQTAVMRTYYGEGDFIEFENAEGVLLTEDDYFLITEHRDGLTDILIGCIKSTTQEALDADTEIDIDIDEEIAKVTWAESYVHGDTGTRPDENVDNAKYYKDKTRENAQCICDMGEITFKELKSVDKQHHYMYTIVDEFTSDKTFLDGGNITYPPRTKVVYYSPDVPNDDLAFEDGDLVITEVEEDNLTTERQVDGLWVCMQGEGVISLKGSYDQAYHYDNVEITKESVGLPNGVNIAISSNQPSQCDYWLCPFSI